MIISASRRTDIPHYYGDWLVNRMKEGFVLVRNPMNPRQVSRILLAPDKVDGFVFWTKNPAPFLKKLEAFKEYPYYFQFTLNGYGRGIEPGVPGEEDGSVDTFRRLSDIVGPDRILWRYDPILIQKDFSLEYHGQAFERLSSKLEGYSGKCVISFVDYYKDASKRMPLRSLDAREMDWIAKTFSQIGKARHFRLETCAEQIDLQKYGIMHGKCVDGSLLNSFSRRSFTVKTAAGQRGACGCDQSADIGAYNTCSSGCLYCYANHQKAWLKENLNRYDPQSPLLCGSVGPEDRITQRKQP